MSYLKPIQALLLATASLTLATGAYAGGPEGGGQQPPPQGQQPPPQAEDFDEETLDKFADAYLDLQDIRNDYTQKLENAGDEQEAQQIQQEASEEMLNALEENDLEVEEYNQIATAMQADPELREKVSKKVEE